VNPYVVFLLYLAAILGVVALTLGLNRVLGPRPTATAMKLDPFEIGRAHV
jgi:NADH-quinone oxidoreductase subunit A